MKFKAEGLLKVYQEPYVQGWSNVRLGLRSALCCLKSLQSKKSWPAACVLGGGKIANLQNQSIQKISKYPLLLHKHLRNCGF